ncbi:MAG: transposase [Pseudomonadota bacterium]|jgi:IS1 family transposase
MANVLPREKQIEIIAALTEGCSIRSVERLTGVHRDTIMRLGVRVGQGCERLHDATMRNLSVSRIEMDEAWSYVGKKQRLVKPEDGREVGDQYIFLAMDVTGKAILSYRVGKRDAGNTHAFVMDVRERVLGAPDISTDAFKGYRTAIDEAFGLDCHYGIIEKHYKMEPAKEAARRYSPGYVVAVSTRQVVGAPDQISTSYIERQNLSLRMGQRRMTRLTNGFSKKLENHIAAVGLYVAHYNLCRVHEALRITPAMQLGVTDHIWTIGELVDAALDGVVEEQVARRVGRFGVIDGGLS